MVANVASLDKSYLTIEIATNKSKAVNILQLSKLPSMICFAQAVKSFRNSTAEEFMIDAATPFAQHSSSHTLDPFSLSLSLYSRLFAVLISSVTLHKKDAGLFV